MTGMKPFRRLACVALLGLAACSQNPTSISADLPRDSDTARIRVVIPDAWELANIILAETDYGVRNANMIWKQGPYYQRVRAHFDSYRTHASMKELQIEGNDPIRRMYEFRENSLAWGFVGEELVRGRRYGTNWQPDRFNALSTHVQSFAHVSKYIAFYEGNESYYAETIARYWQVARPDSLIMWLEREFGRTYDYYTVAISPLIYASHSAWTAYTPRGDEAVFFVSGPDVDGGPGNSPAIRQANVQRILFTELDHLFVNPVTDLYRAQVEAAFGDRTKWSTDNSGFYSGARSVFNEYMTWGVALLYLEGNLPATEFDVFMTALIRQMEQSRHFIKFGAFSRELLAQWRVRAPGTRARALYPAMLDWAARQ